MTKGEKGMLIKDRIASKLPSWRGRVAKLVKEYGSFVIANVTVEQIYGGIRNVPIQVSDISYIDPQEGIRLRGYTIPELLKLLPKASGSEYPLAGGLYYLLMVDELPTMEDALMVEEDWKRRSKIPPYVFKVLKALPPTTHPMAMFSLAILAMHTESIFATRYTDGMQKDEYWDSYLEDSLNLTARLPGVAAFIYNLKYRDGKYIAPNPNLDWSANFAHMIGKGDDHEYQELCRLFFFLHSDHEGGNVSAHTTHLVASALSDVYYACSAGMDGLAGPLHGLANEECLRWLMGVRAKFKSAPSKKDIEKFALDTLNAGRVIPGYGHAVLRITDPRFTAQNKFGQKYMPDDDLFRLVNLIYEVVPGILIKQGKVKNPWPNVDAISGALQYHYGVKEMEFYTLLFGVSRSLGLTTHAMWARALGKPIERPKSLTTRMLEQMISESDEILP
jgi:citrate synthase